MNLPHARHGAVFSPRRSSCARRARHPWAGAFGTSLASLYRCSARPQTALVALSMPDRLAGAHLPADTAAYNPPTD